MAKILNLSKLTKDTGRELEILGKKYKINALTVETFIATSRAVEAIEKEGLGVAHQVSATVEMILSCVPELKREELLGFPLETLSTIANFVRGEDVDEQEVVEGEQGK